VKNSDCGSPLFWHNCYSSGFDLITPESYAHPAKMAGALCFRIFSHLKELGLLSEGDTILDPMGGTGLTAICAGASGYPAITVELEQKFVDFQKDNKTYAERRLFKELDWQILQGDSRYLSQIIQGQYKSIMSPPYLDALNPPHTEDLEARRLEIAKEKGISPDKVSHLDYTKAVTVTSPPYGIDMKTAGGIDWAKANRPDPRIDIDPKTGKAYTRHNVYGVNVGGYGGDDTNIGNLPDKPLKSVMSPPYDGDPGHHGQDENGIRAEKGLRADYGKSDGQIGDTQSESYLSAMKQVYEQIALVSDVLVVVVKNPTRNKQLRRLDLDTIRILQEAGWTIKCQHRALLFEELEQADMFDGAKKKVKGRMSFFKRLSWQAGQPVASWEDVIFAVREGKSGIVTVSSPPYDNRVDDHGVDQQGYEGFTDKLGNYGTTPGQIGNLKVNK